MIEWIVAALGAAIVLALLVYLITEVSRPASPPSLEVRVDSVVTRAGAHIVYFRVANDGRATAADVGLIGELRKDTTSVETREATVVYVPGESHARGALLFERNPRLFTLQLRVTGYREP